MKACPTCGSQWPDETRFCPNDGSTLHSAGGAADLVGSVVADRYHIVKKLGEGGMGTVYLGEHVKMGRKSAIKVMTQAMAHDADAIARFNREAANAARIAHPNVCAIYDFGETHDGLIYLAMEFIEGGSLTSIIEGGALPLARAARILQQTGEALQVAHDLGIVHRDLKPDNIMITRGRDGADVVKVVDFGIAKAMSGEEGQKVTKTGLVVGTPEYMSPEQLSGDKLDGRSDIYSLALVFFRMVTGTLPFQADSAQETMIKRLTDNPMKLSEAMPGADFPPRLQDLMDRALARMPAERYASAADFARDVSTALATTGRTPADDGATQIISSQDPKTTLLAATRVAGGKGRDKTPPTPMPTAVQAPEKKKPVALIAAVIGVLVVGGGGAAMFMLGGRDVSESANGARIDPSVTANTAPIDTQPDNSETNPTRTGNQPPGVTPTGASRADPNPVGQRPVGTQPSGSERPAGIQVDPSQADPWLLARLETVSAGNAAGIRDTALAFYHAPGISRADKAFAAFGVGQAYGMLRQTTEALSWARLAVQLDPTSRPYQQYVADLTGVRE